MSVQILNEITIDIGIEVERTITLWLVSRRAAADNGDYWQFIEELEQWCASKGWSLDCASELFEEPHITHFNDWGDA